MRNRGPWNRVNALKNGWPATAFLDPCPPNRTPRPDDMAAALQVALAARGPADFGCAERQAMARSLGLVGAGSSPTALGRVWAAVWGLKDHPGNLLARRVVAAGTALAADGLPLLVLLAASGGSGACQGVVAEMARVCEVLPVRGGMAKQLRGVIRSLRGCRSQREAARHLRYRVGWLAYFGLARERMYQGWIRPTKNPNRLIQLTSTVLTFNPTWMLQATHLHYAAWLALGGEIPEENDPRDALPSLLRAAVGMLPGLPLREASLLLCALALREGKLIAEPADFLHLLGGLPLRTGGAFVRLPEGRSYILVRGDGDEEAQLKPAPPGAVRMLRSCLDLFPEGALSGPEAPMGIRAALRGAITQLKQAHLAGGEGA